MAHLKLNGGYGPSSRYAPAWPELSKSTSNSGYTTLAAVQRAPHAATSIPEFMGILGTLPKVRIP